MIVRGYKVFHGDMTNRYGLKFEEGKTYYAPDKCGYYYCTRLVDTLVNYARQPGVRIAEVAGEIDEKRELAYRNYGSSQRTSTALTINRILTREEVIDYVLKRSIEEIRTFLMFYLLTPEEKEYLLNIFAGNQEMTNRILTYQKPDEKKKPKARVKTGYVYRPFKKEKKGTC